ncbi:cytochrome c oxidase biogenesis protein Cmc1-like protein [Lineolata rhizophorae]|uniref:COX assembly mitochondrial protein n=1 Tax=Lineolata rhizophorae TaxID=578093 RepID=A0A6A6P828_9PEZI|nr:cytochrome c oxidase biogenesis protein Cmc1-like protein [Lineolata rhizophorae]
MHPHLHTKATKNCEDVIMALEECHARGFLYRAFGGCSHAKHEVNMCLRAERIERTRQNREQAKVRREKIKKVWDDIDANS